MIWFMLVIGVALTFISCGVYMVYSAVTGKGIPHPGDDALLQMEIQYKLRGLIGSGSVVGGIFMLYGIYGGF